MTPRPPTADELMVTSSHRPEFDARPVLAALLGRLPAAAQIFAREHCWFATVRWRDTTGGFTVDLALEATRVARLQERGAAVPADLADGARSGLFLVYLTPVDDDDVSARVVAHEVAHAWCRHHQLTDQVPLAELEREADMIARRWLAEGP